MCLQSHRISVRQQTLGIWLRSRQHKTENLRANCSTLKGMDPVNGDVNIAAVNHTDDSRNGEVDDPQLVAVKSASYWEEVDKEEIERERT